MKNKSVYVVVIIILSIIIFGLIGYIIYNNKSNNQKPNKPNEIVTPENKDNNEKDNNENDNKDNNNKKIINIELKNKESKEIESDTEEVNYKIKIDKYTLSYYYDKGYAYFDIVGELDSVYTGDNNLLYSIQRYNNYAFVTLNCQCGIPASEYVIDLEEKTMSEKLCLPSSNGTCNDYKYINLLSNQYLELKYNINYNTKNITLEKTNKFNCKDYKSYSGLDESNTKECKDNTCKRRVEYCYPYVD